MFDENKMKGISRAAASLCIWVQAVFKYAQISRTMKPKLRELLDAEEELSKVRKKLLTKPCFCFNFNFKLFCCVDEKSTIPYIDNYPASYKTETKLKNLSVSIFDDFDRKCPILNLPLQFSYKNNSFSSFPVPPSFNEVLHCSCKY